MLQISRSQISRSQISRSQISRSQISRSQISRSQISRSQFCRSDKKRHFAHFSVESFFSVYHIPSKINDSPKGGYLLILRLQSILTVANLLAHNNTSQICYCGQISLQSTAVKCSFSDNLAPLG